MEGYVANIEKLSLENKNFRKVVYTTSRSQLVLMSLLPGENIGLETHDVDQFLRIESGKGRAILNSQEHDIGDGFSIVVPASVEHDIMNTGSETMKLYTLYMPPHHKDGTVHATKSEAEADEEEHFDSSTSR